MDNGQIFEIIAFVVLMLIYRAASLLKRFFDAQKGSGPDAPKKPPRPQRRVVMTPRGPVVIDPEAEIQLLREQAEAQARQEATARQRAARLVPPTPAPSAPHRPPTGQARPPKKRAGANERLQRLDRLPPVGRAIVLAELLGRPRATCPHQPVSLR